jgi:hypothetical protein
MNQSKLESLVEAIVNTFIGFFVTMVFLPIVNYLLGISMNLSQASASTAIFTLISVARGYLVRRFFNNLTSLKKWIIGKLKLVL